MAKFEFELCVDVSGFGPLLQRFSHHHGFRLRQTPLQSAPHRGFEEEGEGSVRRQDRRRRLQAQTSVRHNSP